jgi:hypothetical protein
VSDDCYEIHLPNSLEGVWFICHSDNSESGVTKPQFQKSLKRVSATRSHRTARARRLPYKPLFGFLPLPLGRALPPAGPHGAQGSHGKPPPPPPPPPPPRQTSARSPRRCAAVNGGSADPTLNTFSLLVRAAAGRGEAQHRALHRLRPLRRPRKSSPSVLRHRMLADFFFGVKFGRDLIWVVSKEPTLTVGPSMGASCYELLVVWLLAA